MTRVFLFQAILLGFVLCIGLVPSATADQVVNGSFEDPGTVYTYPYPYTGPSSWDQVLPQPLAQYDNGSGPFGTTAFDGTDFAGEATDWGAPKQGGLSQLVNVNFGSSGTVRAMINLRNDQNPEDPNIAKIGIDPLGGDDPEAESIVWAATDVPSKPNWVLLETPEVTAQAAVITVFVMYDIPRQDGGNAVFFDLVQLTGTLTDAALPGTPPDTTGLALVAPQPERIPFEYVLTDGEDADPDATLDPEFRVGRILDQDALPPEVTFVVAAQASMPSAPDGNGTGTGTWRIQGADGGLWYGASSRTGTALAYDTLVPADFPITVDIRISDWEVTGLNVLREGAGICLMTPDKGSYYMVGGFWNGSAVMIESSWHIQGATTSRVESGSNMTMDGYPTDGAAAIVFRITRTASNTLKGSYIRGGGGVFHEIDVSGTTLDLSEDLLIGVVVNDEVTVNVDYIVSAYMDAAPGVGGDGISGLASTSSGNAHTFVWDVASDLVLFPGPTSTQFKIRAWDYNGWGVADESDWFMARGGIPASADHWMLYR